MRRWLRRVQSELEAEREETKEARALSKDVLHEVADVVLKLRAAAEDLERVMQDMAKQETEEERGPTP